MDNHVLERRNLLRGAGVAGASRVGVAAVPGASSAASAGAGHGGSAVLGSWLITHADNPPGDTTKVQSVVGFSAGGVVTVQDIAPVGAAGLGAWRPRGRTRFTLTFWTGQNAHGRKQPAVTVRVQARGSVHRGDISGRYRTTVYDARSGKVVDQTSGHFAGARIEA
ncbi:MAG: hypothetical protein ACXVXD_05170 [Nocardioidaceae bacterium]